MVTMGVFPFQGKTHMVEPGIEHGTSCLVVRTSDHQATRLVSHVEYCDMHFVYGFCDGNARVAVDE